MKGMLLSAVLVCASASMPCSCRAMEGSRCSAPDVIDAVKSLAGEHSNNPLAAALIKALNTTFSLDAIRTVSSSPSRFDCEARLTLKSDPPAPPAQAGEPALIKTPQAKAIDEETRQQLSTIVKEISYKVELTDDGHTYVTIVPSDAEIRDQENRQQRYQEQESEQGQQSRAEQQRVIQQEEQYERDLQESWRR